MPRQCVLTYAEPSICRLLSSGGKRNISKNSVPSYPIRHFVTWPTFRSPCALNAGKILGLSTILWLGKVTSYMNTLSGNQQNSYEYKVKKTKYCSKLPRFTLPVCMYCGMQENSIGLLICTPRFTKLWVSGFGLVEWSQALKLHVIDQQLAELWPTNI